MDKEYKEIKFSLGSTIEQAVNELLDHNSHGKLVYGVFNGVSLHSDTVTLDGAYVAIIGKTKVEFEKYLE